MPNRWIEFVKSWAKKMNVSYGCALSNPQLKLAYRKAYPTKVTTKLNETMERFKMSSEDIQSRIDQQLAKERTETETMGAEDRNVALSIKKPISKRDKYNKLKEEYNRVKEEAKKTKDTNLIKKAKKLKAEAEQLAIEIKETKQMGAEDRNVAQKQKKILSEVEKFDKVRVGDKISIQYKNQPHHIHNVISKTDKSFSTKDFNAVGEVGSIARIVKGSKTYQWDFV
jgi:hypothetical protein